MSLSMQMTRGALALSLLLLLAVLAAVSKQPAHERIGALPVAATVAVCELPQPRVSSWRLAQTPADLGPLARRWESCRA